MRGKSEFPTLHAGQHAPDGSDPLTGFIRYDFENVGDWLHITATGPTVSGSILSLYSAGDLGISAESSIVIDSTNGTGGNIALVGIGVTIDSYSGQSITVTGDGAGARILLKSNNDDVQIQIGAGANLEVLDGSGNPKIRWTDGTNDIHIPTGGTIIADL